MAENSVKYRLRVHSPGGEEIAAKVDPPSPGPALELDHGKLQFRADKVKVAICIAAQDEPPAPAVMQVPLKTSFKNAGEAKSWLLAHPLRVDVDGAPIAFHSGVSADGSIGVSFQVPPGRHQLRVVSVPKTGPQFVWLARDCTVSAKG